MLGPGLLLLLAAALLACCTGETSDNGYKKEIRAFVGDTVTLPCHITITGDIPTMEWIRTEPAEAFAFVYRNGCETFAMKNPVFLYRTNLFLNEVKNGNFSLRISNVQLSDAGKYQCKIVQGKTSKVTNALELFVGAVSEPKLSVVPGARDGVTLQCESNCWFPEPEITFLDDQGNNISAENPKRGEDSRGCFTVTRRAFLPTATNRSERVTCRVHQPQINQTRDTELCIPANYTCSCHVYQIIVVVAVIIIVILSFLVAFSFIKQCRCESKRSSNQHTASRAAKGHDLRNKAGSTENATAKQLRKKIQELESNLDDKEKLIQQLTEKLKDVRSKQSHVVCQHSQPTIDNSPSKSSPDISNPFSPRSHQFPQGNNPNPAASTNNNHPKPDNLPQRKDSKPGISIKNPTLVPLFKRGSDNNSIPARSASDGAASSSVSSASTSEGQPLVRSKSLSESRPHPHGARFQQRYTMSVQVQNRFSSLADLEEDSELLIK
ncbi:butyrophilin subfamily 3 member A2-like isoform X2 [Trachinotus anak]|uniref:butyrophilin subfamily 3 member A2-like isoform X2 n=1 Tax=Trachinotus anak TaxID=443729 RepID=UPI0039F1F38A